MIDIFFLIDLLFLMLLDVAAIIYIIKQILDTCQIINKENEK